MGKLDLVNRRSERVNPFSTSHHAAERIGGQQLAPT